MIKIMLMKTTFFILTLFCFCSVEAQNSFVGTFSGVYNGDKLTMILESKGGNNLTGKMKDSEQTYDITAVASGNSLKGTAVQSALFLNLPFDATLSGNELSLAFDLSAFGTNQKMLVNLTKQGTSSTAKPITSSSTIVKGKRDPAIVGQWSRSESYSSGSGDSYFSGTTQSSMVFNADGSLIDGGSRTVVGGSNYTGDTGTSKAKPLEGVSWYSENNNIYLVVSQNGKSQTVKLGRYYIENGKMLITGDNGKKELFYRN